MSLHHQGLHFFACPVSVPHHYVILTIETLFFLAVRFLFASLCHYNKRDFIFIPVTFLFASVCHYNTRDFIFFSITFPFTSVCHFYTRDFIFLDVRFLFASVCHNHNMDFICLVVTFPVSVRVNLSLPMQFCKGISLHVGTFSYLI